MKRLIAFALVLAALAPAVSAQTSAGFAGKWEGTFTMQRPDGTEGNTNPVVFNITQKGKEGGRVALVGIVVGTLAAVGLTRYVATLLFDVGRLDGLAFVGTSAVMFAVALLASYVPARRASRVDPVVALRAE